MKQYQHLNERVEHDMTKLVLMVYSLGAGLLILAGCIGSDQRETPTSAPTLAPTPNPTYTATATATPTPIPTATTTSGEVALRIITLLRKDAIPAILEPQFASPQSAEKHMTDTEQVIGVFINGDARAYPIEILSDHEIVNDVVGGEPIAVTW